jgi:hypothetical protein
MCARPAPKLQRRPNAVLLDRGEGGILALEGPARIGKTALLRQLAVTEAARGARILVRAARDRAGVRLRRGPRPPGTGQHTLPEFKHRQQDGESWPIPLRRNPQ